jgi:hypothetical protein
MGRLNQLEFKSMRAFWSGHVPPRSANVLSRFMLVVLALMVAGCAPSGRYIPQSWNAGGPQPAVANVRQPRVEMEGDGLPAQTPPLRRERSEPDDPKEPFSPNYGSPSAPPAAKKAAALANTITE